MIWLWNSDNDTISHTNRRLTCVSVYVLCIIIERWMVLSEIQRKLWVSHRLLDLKLSPPEWNFSLHFAHGCICTDNWTLLRFPATTYLFISFLISVFNENHKGLENLYFFLFQKKPVHVNVPLDSGIVETIGRFCNLSLRGDTAR